MWEGIVKLLLSSKRAERFSGWTKLHSDFTMLQKTVSQSQREVLVGLLMDEEDDGVWRAGINSMMALAPPAAESPVAPPPSHAQLPSNETDDDSLASWLWQPFKKKSAVFGLADSKYRRRDELSLIYLARYFCLHRFPATDIHLMGVDDPHWDRLLFNERYQSMCFVGRLGIFGDKAVNRWGNRDCRFGFLTQHRPMGLPPGELHEDYHCITEDLPNGLTDYHRSAWHGQEHLDYGIVQRYLVSDGTRGVVVVNCAGGSALGTLAATTWAINDLKEPLGPESGPLPSPPDLPRESPLEALVYVKADSTGDSWLPSEIELRRLYAGRHLWCSDDRVWKPLATSRITLVAAGDRVVQVELDGKAAPLRPGKQAFSLLVKMCEGVLQRGDGMVDLAELAQDREIWSGRPRTETAVRRSLANLKHRYLHECLEIDQTVTLTADVEKTQQ